MKNYEAKIIVDTNLAELKKRSKGDVVYIHIDEKEEVLVYSPHNRKHKQAQVIGLFISIEEAKKYLTCIKSTDVDVKRLWSDALNNRYW